MKLLHKYGIYHNNIKRALFDNFLFQPGHEHFLQDFLIFCCSSEQQRLQNIIKAFEFTIKGNYTYGRLFRIHPGWKEFFVENAWSCGIAKEGENRLGVSAKVVDNVMRHFKGDLDSAIFDATTPS